MVANVHWITTTLKILSMSTDRSYQGLHNVYVPFRQHLLDTYHKFPEYSEPQKIIVLTVKFELCGSTME